MLEAVGYANHQVRNVNLLGVIRNGAVLEHSLGSIVASAVPEVASLLHDVHRP